MNQDLLNKAKKSYKSSNTLSEFFDHYDDKDIIYLMNNIAMNTTKENSSMAKMVLIWKRKINSNIN